MNESNSEQMVISRTRFVGWLGWVVLRLMAVYVFAAESQPFFYQAF